MMSGPVSSQRILEIARKPPSRMLLSWALEFGIERFPELKSDLCAAALATAERDAEAIGQLQRLNEQRAWPHDPQLAARLSALLSRAPERRFRVVLEALAICQGAAARETLLQYLDSRDLRRAGQAAGLLSQLPDGPVVLLERLRRNPALAEHIARPEALLLGPGWNNTTLEAALGLFTKLPPDEEAADEAQWDILQAFGGDGYTCATVPDGDGLEGWAEAVARECQPVFSLDLARRVARFLPKGKGFGAVNALQGALPRPWLGKPQADDEPEAALARAVLSSLRANGALRDKLAKTHPQFTCGLIAAATARLVERQTAPAADPAAASLAEALEAVKWPRPHLPREAAWVARAASFGAEAVEPLAACLREQPVFAVRRAAQALAAIPRLEAVKALAAHAKDEAVEEALKTVDRALLLEADAEIIRDALARGDDTAVFAAMWRWNGAEPHGDALVELLLPSAERLVFTDPMGCPFAEFVEYHPDPGFLPLADLWRAGEPTLADIAVVLLAAHRPDDPRLAQMLADQRAGEEALVSRLDRGLDSSLDSVRLQLRCRRCQAAYHYEIRQIFFGTDVMRRKENMPLEECARIEDVIVCKRCGAIDEYEWTDMARTAFYAQASVLPYAKQDRGPLIPHRSTSSVGDSLTFSEVLERLDQRVAEEPDNRQHHLHRGNTLFNMRRLQAALEAYSATLARWPDYAEASYQRGLAYARLRRHAEALADFASAALNLKPADDFAGPLQLELRGILRCAARDAGKPTPLDALEALDRVQDALPEADQKPLPFPRRSPPVPAATRQAAEGYEAEEEDLGEDEEWDEDEEGDAGAEDDEDYGDEDEEYEDEESEDDYDEAEEPADLRPRAGRPRHEDAARRLSRELAKKVLLFGKRYLPEKDWDDAITRWLGRPSRFRDYLDDQAEAHGEQADASFSQFIEYHIYDWRATPDGQTLLERYRVEEWPRLSHAEQAQLTAWLERRRCGWYEVDATDREEHLTTLHDCLTGDSFQVYDHTLAAAVGTGRMVVSALLPCAERLEISGSSTEVPRHVRHPLRAWLLREYEAWKSARSASLDSSWPRYFSEQFAEICRECTHLATLRPIVVLGTGEEPSPGHAVYEVVDRQAVRAALESWPELVYDGWGKGEELEGDRYTWQFELGGPPLPFAKPLPKEGNSDGRQVLALSTQVMHPDNVAPDPLAGKHHVLGSLTFARQQLEVSAFSRERLAHLQEQLAQRLKDAVRLAHAKQQEPGFVERLRERRGTRPAERSDERDPALEKLSASVNAQYLRSWVDMALPALNGKTPRQAATDPALRGEVEALLRDMETRSSAERRPAPEHSAALRQVRAELGL